MWTCPTCQRKFKSKNQWHYCAETTIDEIFANTPDHLILAFDKLLTGVIQWDPCTIGAAKKAVVFTSKKAWLILRPMRKVLQLKFYCDQPLESELFRRVHFSQRKFAHHLHIADEDEINEEVLRLLRTAHRYSLT